ncbi:MAG: hypothetical protein AAF270_01015 [Pseudomonadota bacterium]
MMQLVGRLIFRITAKPLTTQQVILIVFGQAKASCDTLIGHVLAIHVLHREAQVSDSIQLVDNGIRQIV